MRTTRVRFTIRRMVVVVAILAMIFAAYVAGRREVAGPVRSVMVITTSEDGTSYDYLRYTIRQ